MTQTPPQTSLSQSASDIKVMLVDDSAVIRGALGRIIDAEPGMVVAASVQNGEMAVSTADHKKPDVVLLDIEMPVMDGLTALPEILKISPDSKVIMFSSLTEKGAVTTLRAFSLGAVECLVKPSSDQPVGPGSDFQKNLTDLIRNLGQSGAVASPQSSPTPTSVTAAPAASAAPAAKSLLSANFSLYDDTYSYKGKPEIIAIGSSTGGPNALFEVLKSFKDFDVPIVLTQHMPAMFTKILAQHITQNTGLEAAEAVDGDVLEAGRVYVAPGDFHMRFKSSGGPITAVLDQEPAVNFCRPAVDPMFESIVGILGKKVLGVMLTGMGQDGLDGSKKLVESGGRLVAQDEATSTVWGMPGAVAKANLCSAVLPLQNIGPWVKDAMAGKHL